MEYLAKKKGKLLYKNSVRRLSIALVIMLSSCSVLNKNNCTTNRPFNMAYSMQKELELTLPQEYSILELNKNYVNSLETIGSRKESRKVYNARATWYNGLLTVLNKDQISTLNYWVYQSYPDLVVSEYSTKSKYTETEETFY